MSDFLGTKLTNHDVNEVRREFRKKRKHNHYDEYDFYVYYKNLLAEERKKKEKRERSKRRKEKEQAEAEDEFKPTNYISSRYKRNEDVVKKGIYDYIDEEDSIYEDIITSANFDDKANYADDLQFSFFNESVSYALLRNNNYIDGIPIGIDMKVGNKYIREDASNSNNANMAAKQDSVTSMGTSRHVSSPLGEKPNAQVKKNSTEESNNDDVGEGDSSKRRKAIGPKLPTIFEQIRHKIGEQTDITERNENEYINILSSRNRLILLKMEEQKKFEKLIKEIYKPKNNFEGAFYKKKENSIDQVKKREMNRLRKDFLLPHRRGIHDEGSIDAPTQIEITTTGRKQTFGQTDYEDYSDSSLENAYTSSARRNTNKGYAMVLDRKSRQSEDSCIIPYNNFSIDIDSGEEDAFVLYNPGEYQAEEMLLLRSKFYRTLFRSRCVEKPYNRALADEIEDLNMRYAKLINPNMEAKLSKSELLELYVPKKSWVQTGNTLTHDEQVAQNEIYVLKNKINFNNDLKKKHRFYFYCRMKEGRMNADGSLSRRVDNILSAAERAEFEELMGKLKVYYLDFYNREIANEDVSTNFKIQEYEFEKCVCEKLGISDPSAGDQSGAEMEERSIVDDFLKIPQFVFDAIFCA
ncbi:hypothetical protein PCYB_122690 [Plasmodium cynomolgi strain B]|uniref:Uncharacterized protein n=1 Tax=Plasmodium cynomolgi (strain B) TaxID=1120755 RepID=K6VEL6_PLACD|nr:hypothetical protein PCYB_122690 [Plasmodium cynomolgi strain B]GAB67702.1 hypothetical protein PCYB_122690 [Plasmodium cynomolgi strain B]